MQTMTFSDRSYLPRTLERVIEKASQRFKGIAVTGMRQVGKSTLLCHADAARRYVSLDSFRALDLARHAPESFFSQYPAPILIDEFQRAPELGLQIKALLDAGDERGRIWLTGSHKLGMRQALSEALSGRVATYELFPMSLYEIQGKGLEQEAFLPDGTLGRGKLDPMTAAQVWARIWQGSWPEVLSDAPDLRDAFFDSLLRTVLEKDVVAANVRRIEDFARFITALAGRIGQELSLGEVQKELGIAAETAREWLNVAVQTGFVWLLPPFSENVGKTLIKKPKLYFTDTGFACWLCRIPGPEALRGAYNAGAFFENFVVMEIAKSWVHNGKRPLFYFYRDTRRHEIDLLIREGECYYPIEIKTTADPDRKMLDNFSVLKGGSVRRGPGALICLCSEARYLTDDVVAMPIWNI